MKFSPITNLIAGIGFCSVILIWCIARSFSSSNDLYHGFNQMEHTYEVMESIKDIELNITKAESNVRVYYITRDSRFSYEYKKNTSNVWVDYKNIESLTMDNPSQQKNIGELKALLKERIQYFEESLSLVGNNEPWQRQLTEKVVLLNLKLDRLYKRIDDKEKALLLNRRENTFNTLSSSQLNIIISGIIALVVSLLLIFLVRKDIQRQKKTEKELRELNENKNKFFSIVSHDMRGPVKAISTLSKMLLDRRNLNNLSDYLIELNSSAEKAESLLDNLLLWARSQMDKIEFKMEVINMKDILNQNITSVRHAAAEKGIYINYSLHHDIWVYADRRMIEMVTRNLLWNAIKFTNNGGFIAIDIRNADDHWIVSVEDSGIGIPTSDMDKLFSINTNYTRKGTYNEEGTGLGLILCKDFIERNGGKIWVESVEGKGTTFYYSLKSMRADENSLSPSLTSILRNKTSKV